MLHNQIAGMDAVGVGHHLHREVRLGAQRKPRHILGVQSISQVLWRGAQTAEFLFGAAAVPHIALHVPLARLLATGLAVSAIGSLGLMVQPCSLKC